MPTDLHLNKWTPNSPGPQNEWTPNSPQQTGSLPPYFEDYDAGAAGQSGVDISVKEEIDSPPQLKPDPMSLMYAATLMTQCLGFTFHLSFS